MQDEKKNPPPSAEYSPEGSAPEKPHATRAQRKPVKVQGIRYILVGLSSAVIELILFQGLFTVIGWGVAPSNITAVVCSTTFNFLMSRNWTFQGSSNALRSLLLYLLLFVFNATFTTFAIAFMVDGGVPSLLAKLGTMGCVVLWNFVLYRKVIFK